MNERIKELAKQAGFEPFEVRLDDTKLEKFAELIVRECMERIKVVIAEEAMNVNSDYFYYDFKQHFGVEE